MQGSGLLALSSDGHHRLLQVTFPAWGVRSMMETGNSFGQVSKERL